MLPTETVRKLNAHIEQALNGNPAALAVLDTYRAHFSDWLRTLALPEFQAEAVRLGLGYRVAVVDGDQYQIMYGASRIGGKAGDLEELRKLVDRRLERRRVVAEAAK